MSLLSYRVPQRTLTAVARIFGEIRVMKKAVWSGAVATAVLLLGSSTAFAQQTATASIAVTASVNAKAKLTLGLAAITFADADPDVTPLYTSAPVSVSVKARTTVGG